MCNDESVDGAPTSFALCVVVVLVMWWRQCDARWRSCGSTTTLHHEPRSILDDVEGMLRRRVTDRCHRMSTAHCVHKVFLLSGASSSR